MPIFEYRCTNCTLLFEEYHPISAKDKLKQTNCPNCKRKALRYYGSRFSSPGKIEQGFAEDEPQYREMHYYEKKGDWQRAADAAKGVSRFAREKFLQKAWLENRDKSRRP